MKPIENTSDRIKKALSARNVKQIELTELTGISKSAISGYINGNYSPKQGNIYKMASALNVSPSWLMGFDVPMDMSADEYLKIFELDNVLKIKKSTKKIPLLGTIAASNPILAEEHIDEYIDFDEKVQADFCLRVKGDSMINANIKSGDIVFIKKQSDVDDGEIAAVLIDGEATLKRVYKIGGVVQLRAENPSFPPITLDGGVPALILGKATYKLSKVL